MAMPKPEIPPRIGFLVRAARDPDLCDQPVWTEQVVAYVVNCSVHLTRKWRYQGGGPKFYKIGRNVRYRPADVEEWLYDLNRTSTSAKASSK